MKFKPKRKRGRPNEPVNRESWRARCEAALAREHRLRLRWVSLSELGVAWRGVVALVARASADWPARIAERIGRAQSPQDVLGVDKTWKQPPESPWCPKHGFTQTAPPADPPDCGPCLYPEPPAPVVRPLLEQLSAVTKQRPFQKLAAVLTGPPPLELPPDPQTTVQARQQFLAANTAYVRTKTAVERPGSHVRRALAEEAAKMAIAEFKARWWASRGDYAQVAGDERKAREVGERLRDDSIRRLSTLGGLISKEQMMEATTKRVRRRKTRKK